MGANIVLHSALASFSAPLVLPNTLQSRQSSLPPEWTSSWTEKKGKKLVKAPKAMTMGMMGPHLLELSEDGNNDRFDCFLFPFTTLMLPPPPFIVVPIQLLFKKPYGLSPPPPTLRTWK